MSRSGWYVDPLGRYDGRFFDGETWTAKVSAHGKLALDPKWPTAATDTPVDRGEATTTAESTSVDRGVESPDRIVTPLPARPSHLVADQPASRPPGAGVPLPAQPSLDVPATAVSPGGLPRWLLPAVAAVLVAALAIFALTRGSDDEIADDSSADPTGQVGDASEGAGLPATDPEADVAGSATTDFDASDDESNASESAESASASGESDEIESDEIESEPAGTSPSSDDDIVMAGSVEIVNGRSVIDGLASWHRDALERRGQAPLVGSWCYFSTFDDELAATAFCGPVAEDDGVPLFDAVLLAVDDLGEGQVEVKPAIDGAELEVALPSGHLLAGTDGPIDPTTLVGDPTLDEGKPKRGSRGS